MRSIIFDTGAIISLAMNDLLWTLPLLKKKFSGEFYITPSVKYELIDRPLKSRKYKFEAINILNLMNKGVLKVYDKLDVKELLDLTNSIYSIKNEHLKLIQEAELEALYLANKLNSDLYVVDERTMRMFVEDPKKLKSLLERKFGSVVDINKEKLNEFQNKFGSVKIIRSTELMAVAYERGLFNDFKGVSKTDFLDGLFWALKLRGVSISEDEINQLTSLVK